MRISFRNLFIENCPDDVEDLIFRFAYGLTRLELYQKCYVARQTSRCMPVPPKWKNLYDTSGFRFDRFLNGNDCMIDLDAVCISLDLLNWNIVKAKRSPISSWASVTTKVAIRRGLKSKPFMHSNLVNMVWTLLCCATVDDFRCVAFRDNLYYPYCVLPNFSHPLSYYFPYPHRSIAAMMKPVYHIVNLLLHNG
jgi:hypothetical protein